jgi:hypothetical protein
MIEQYRKAKIALDRDQFLELRGALLAASTDSWTFLRDRELDFSPGGTSVLFAYRNGDLPNADLSVAWYDGQASIGNIVPEHLGQLTMAEYNALLVDFHRQRLAPAAQALGLQLNLTADQRDLTDWISAAATRQLQNFSNLANKGSGASHLLDRRRWLDFIIAVHQEGARLPQEVLQKWLVDELHWPETTAADLTADFGNGIELLERYDESR